jgi:uracil-DNA glycosylase family 4
MDSFSTLSRTIIACTRCPRLVEYRERVARVKRRMYRDQEYWGKPLPGFGDPQARVLVLGLAPAAHGGNRTGRMFTGDRSGDWLFGALHRHGFANQPTSQRREDSLALHDAYVSAAARCAPPANRPLPQELANCQPYLLRELELLRRLRVVLALGQVAFDAYLAIHREREGPLKAPLPRFGHGASYAFPNGITLLASYHPSQRNTQTGLLTPPMFDAVFAAVRRLLEAP